MKLTSSAFSEGESIPALYTCQGKDINPPLAIEDVPKGTQTLALIMDDPDVPEWVRKDKMWVHWVVFNISPKMTTIAEKAEPFGTPGQNTGGKNAYMGPCPPDREHRYFFKLYALDTKLDLPEGATKDQVLDKMKGHVLSEARLMGRYVKS